MSGIDDEQLTEAEPEWGDQRGSWWRGHRTLAVALLVVVLAALGLGLGLSLGSGSSGPPGPEGAPVQPGLDLASADSTAPGTPVDGITCRTSKEEKVKYHIHVLVQIFVNGKQVRIPAGAGIGAPRFPEHLANGLFVDNSVNGCLYWIHTHAHDGIVHVEAPYKGVFTLGEFFDIWQQPLGLDQVGPARGAVVAYENGRLFRGNPRDMLLTPHAQIQLDVGSPAVPYQPVDWTVTGLCSSGSSGCATSGG